MKPLRVILFTGLAMVLVLPAPGSAQAPPGTSDTGLVMEREVFQYPQYARRNPFAPLLSAAGGGPRFERLLLLGVIYSPEASRSIALFGEATATVVTGSAISVSRSGRTYRLKVGGTIGNTTVLEIHPRHVVVAVDEFGQSEQHTMELRRRTVGQGGPP